MLKPAVTLDADMRADAVLDRLALLGCWMSEADPAVHRRLAPLAQRLNKSIETVARQRARDPAKLGAAIRQQQGAHVVWHALELAEVLQRCASAPAASTLAEVLDLAKRPAPAAIQWSPSVAASLRNGVVLDGFTPVAVSLGLDDEAAAIGAMASAPRKALRAPQAPSAYARPGWNVSRGEVERPVAPVATNVEAWPRIDAPSAVRAGQPFKVVVGFGAARQLDVAGGAVVLPAAPGVDALDISIELSSDACVEALNGWSRPLRVPLNDVLAAQVTFELVGKAPPDPSRPCLTMLEVRYVLDGTVCGLAARPLAIVQAEAEVMPASNDDLAAFAASPFNFQADALAPDLTIEITKPDRSAATGQYVCQLYSPHALTTDRGPHAMDLGHDAKTFAKAIVDEVRLLAASELLDTTLEGFGRLVAQCLPTPVFEALREVAARTAPATPAVLIVSAEPYVPWELAWLDLPLDAARPAYLGAQVLLGRWLRDANPAPQAGVAPRPVTHPNAHLPVRHLAAMAAWYKIATGLRRLPMAENEVKAIADDEAGLSLPASAAMLDGLLKAAVKRDDQLIGGVDAVHFAGHGDFDPSRPDGAALFLEDGTPLRSTAFRAARYGGECQPLLFLNACMLGIGGELLGDMGGFPGNSLRGGFGGVLGALWEVDDQVAHDVALEFWRRALPPAPARGEPIGAILRDLRTRYAPEAKPAPVATYLAYVYYGHPRLTLQRQPL